MYERINIIVVKIYICMHIMCEWVQGVEVLGEIVRTLLTKSWRESHLQSLKSY